MRDLNQHFYNNTFKSYAYFGMVTFAMKSDVNTKNKKNKKMCS